MVALLHHAVNECFYEKVVKVKADVAANLHVLPAGFLRIRYFGMLANRHPENLVHIQNT